jgi:UDP-N-acetylmuramoyl-tripeptide--D-alanyl-D-alanine ligase
MVGEMVAENNIDYLLAYGTDAKYYVSKAQQMGVKNSYLFDDKEILANKLLEITDSGDVVMFKGSRGMKLEDVINMVYKRWEK